jgi:hypothetical protein
MIYPSVGVRKHDPSGGTHKRSIPLLLDPGDSITAASITAVDGNDVQINGDTLQINSITFALTKASTTGDTWTINFSPLLGTPNTTYLLRLRYTLASQPSTPQEDLTYTMRCEQT